MQRFVQRGDRLTLAPRRGDPVFGPVDLGISAFPRDVRSCSVLMYLHVTFRLCNSRCRCTGKDLPAGHFMLLQKRSRLRPPESHPLDLFDIKITPLGRWCIGSLKRSYQVRFFRIPGEPGGADLPSTFPCSPGEPLGDGLRPPAVARRARHQIGQVDRSTGRWGPDLPQHRFWVLSF